MFTNFLLIIVLLILLIEAYVIFSLIKIVKNFLGEIQSIKGVQFGSLQIGDDAPLFRDIDHRNEKIILADLISEKNNIILLFISATCPSCLEVVKNMHNLNINHNNYILTVSNEKISIGDITSNLPNFSLINAPHLFSSYKVTKTPFMFILGNDGNVKNFAEINDFSHLNNLLIAENASAV